jgi:hypothetical protein
MEPMDGEARARWLREDIERKVVTLRRLREERLVIRAETAPHLRRLLDERIESVARELENALPRSPLHQPLPDADQGVGALPLPSPALPAKRRRAAEPTQSPAS